MSKRWYLKPLGALAYWHYLLCLKCIKSLGYKLVWTAHNVLPHEQAFPDDVAARKNLIAAADLVIAHSTRTLRQLDTLGLKPQRSIIIPIGSYVGVYPDRVNRKEARRKLGVEPMAFVYLYIGLIRKYKGIDDLLKAYERLKGDAKQLVIAGACSDPELRSLLRNAALSRNILWHDGYVADQDLQVYFNAADVTALPFKGVTTSGSALLSFSFGKTIVVPCVGDMADLPEAVAYKYSPEENDGLLRTMERAMDNKDELRRKSEAALRYAERLSWPSIAQRTEAAMRELF